jgi:hypothetical protein
VQAHDIKRGQTGRVQCGEIGCQKADIADPGRRGESLVVLVDMSISN